MFFNVNSENEMKIWVCFMDFVILSSLVSFFLNFLIKICFFFNIIGIKGILVILFFI